MRERLDIGEFVLKIWHNDGIIMYTVKKYGVQIVCFVSKLEENRGDPYES